MSLRRAVLTGLCYKSRRLAASSCKKSDAPPRRRKDAPYLSLKNATRSLPSFNLTIN
jgi:hypothetical protein